MSILFIFVQSLTLSQIQFCPTFPFLSNFSILRNFQFFSFFLSNFSIFIKNFSILQNFHFFSLSSIFVQFSILSQLYIFVQLFNFVHFCPTFQFCAIFNLLNFLVQFSIFSQFSTLSHFSILFRTIDFQSCLKLFLIFQYLNFRCIWNSLSCPR